MLVVVVLLLTFQNVVDDVFEYLLGQSFVYLVFRFDFGYFFLIRLFLKIFHLTF